MLSQIRIDINSTAITQEVNLTTFSFKRFLIALLIGAVAILSGYYAPFFLVIVVAAIGCVGVAWGLQYSIVSLVPACGGLIVIYLSDPYTLCCVVGMFLIGLITLFLGLKYKLPYRFISIYLALLILIGMYLLICVPALMEGAAPYANIKSNLLEMDKLTKSYYGDNITTDFEMLADMISILFYGVLFALSEFLAFISVIVSKRLCSILKANVRPMEKLMYWRIPDSLKIGLPVLAVSCIIFALAEFQGTDLIVYSLMGLFLPILFIQGFAHIVFLVSRGKSSYPVGKSSEFSIFAYIVLALFAWIFPFVFIILGIVELYANMRLKVKKVDAKIRKAFEIAELEKRDVVTVDFDDGRGPQIIAVRKRKSEDGKSPLKNNNDEASLPPSGESKDSKNNDSDGVSSDKDN